MDKMSLYIHKYATPVLPKGDLLQSVRKNLRVDANYSNVRLNDKVVY